MTDDRGWAIGSERYAKRAQARKVPPGRADKPEPRRPDEIDRVDATGINWNSAAVDWSSLQQSAVERVRSRYRGALPEYIWDAAVLEGNPYTLPEVQTLLEGVTVTGHTLSDQNQILALNEAYNSVDNLVGTERFQLDKPTSDLLHRQVAIHEAIESGHFRGEGFAGGGGLVGLGELGTFRASAPGKNGDSLIAEHRQLIAYLAELDDPREQAIAYFCAATRRQFYFDGNKRTARLMMAGHLLSHGYDAVSIPARRRLEFNDKLGRMFDDGDATEMMAFIIDCRPAE